MKLRKLCNGRALYVTPGVIWVARGMSFYAINHDGKRVGKKFCVGGWVERVLGAFRLSRQALRLGLHHLLPLNNGNILVTAKRRTYILSSEGRVLNTFQGYQGNKPAHQGICVTPDGIIFFAEYLLNPNRDHAVGLYRSIDNGINFQIVKEWPAGDIRHLHFVKWDDHEQCLWLGTGDYGENNRENRLYKSTDNGETWSVVGQGSQDWRAIGVCFTADALTWGTDAGSCPDTVHFVRMNRCSQQLEIVDNFEGPCHGCASYKDGRIFFSTGVEGGENEKDRYARLKEYKDGRIIDVWKMKKDLWPLIVQYGVMRFPLGTDACNRVVFTCMGLRGHGETVMVEED